MIVWGGYFCDGTQHFLNTGGKYNPSANIWAPTSTTDAPTGRNLHSAVWTGSEMNVWSGQFSLFDYAYGTGCRYDPATNTSTATTTANAPIARIGHTAVWTGSEMIVWGGYSVLAGTLDTGGRYCAYSASPTPTPTASLLQSDPSDR